MPVGRPIERWGFHNLRHSSGSWQYPKVWIENSLLHALPQPRTHYAWIYSHVIDANKLAAQGQYLETLLSTDTMQ